MANSGEVAIGGVRSGLIGFGEEVTWRARHFGLSQTLTSRITLFERPHHFRDSMVTGAFKYFNHDHHFRADGKFTIMKDTFTFESPFGVIGRLLNVVVLTRYMSRLLSARAERLKAAVESEEWKEYLSPER